MSIVDFNLSFKLFINKSKYIVHLGTKIDINNEFYNSNQPSFENRSTKLWEFVIGQKCLLLRKGYNITNSYSVKHFVKVIEKFLA